MPSVRSLSVLCFDREASRSDFWSWLVCVGLIGISVGQNWCLCTIALRPSRVQSMYTIVTTITNWQGGAGTVRLQNWVSPLRQVLCSQRKQKLPHEGPVLRSYVERYVVNPGICVQSSTLPPLPVGGTIKQVLSAELMLPAVMKLHRAYVSRCCAPFSQCSTVL